MNLTDDKFHAIVDDAVEAVLILDVNFNAVYHNKVSLSNFRERYGVEDPYNWNALTDSEEGDPRNFFQSIANHNFDTTPSHIETKTYHVNGNDVYVQNTTHVVYDVEGKKQYYVIETVDKTYDHIRDQRLRKKIDRFHLLVYNSIDAIVMVDHENRIQEWNPAAEKMFGYKRQEVLNRKFEDVVMPLGVDGLYNDNLRKFNLTANGDNLDRMMELSVERKDGKLIPTTMSTFRILNNGSKEYIAVLRDNSNVLGFTTDLKNQNEKLSELNLELRNKEEELQKITQELEKELQEERQFRLKEGSNKFQHRFAFAFLAFIASLILIIPFIQALAPNAPIKESISFVREMLLLLVPSLALVIGTLFNIKKGLLNNKPPIEN